MSDREELLSFFEAVVEDKRKFAEDTIDEYLFFREKIAELQKLPLIAVSKKNPALQKITPAGKQIKDYSQVLDAKRGTLLRILYRTESSAADELAEKLKGLEL